METRGSTLLTVLLLTAVIAGHLHSSDAALRKPRVQGSQSQYSVDKYGAKGDGRTDDSAALLKAFSAACGSGSAATMLIPGRRTYLAKSTLLFNGPCKGGPIYIQVDGTVRFDAASTASTSINALWEIRKVTTLRMGGKGTIDGKGADWWSRGFRPHLLQITQCSYVKVYGFTTKDAPRMHINFQYSQHVEAYNLVTSAPSDSPNTDSLHVGNCDDVYIHDTTLHSGDDCVSIVGDSKNVVVKGVSCTAGHGYSIGSLGYGGDTVCINNVTIRDSYLEGTTNGVRIKSYQGGQGLVSNVLFKNIRVKDVYHPIIINQFYCDKKPCSAGSSAVALYNIKYESIVGTTTDSPNWADGSGVSIKCDTSTPCSNLALNNINVWPSKAGTKLQPVVRAGFGSVSQLKNPTGLSTNGNTPSSSEQGRIRSQASKCGVGNIRFR